VHEVREYRREYPEGEAAAQLVGFTNLEERGQEGIELTFQRQLSGKAGSRNVIRDRFGLIVEDTGNSVLPVDGQDVTLSMDSKVQFFAYQQLRDAVRKHKAKSGSVVVLDARSGEVLAMTSYPSFDPAERRSLSAEQLRERARNRAITDTFEPGSTMKPLIASLAMERGIATPRTVIQTAPGWINVTGSIIRDSHPHGALTLAEVIQKSSNVGVVKLAQQIPAQAMYDLYSQVGLGQKPQIDFPGAVSGRLRPWKTWKPVEQATMAYGYGLSASLLQLARAYTVFAHDGELMPVTVLRDLGRADAGARSVPSVVRVAQREGAAPTTIEVPAAGSGVRVLKPETVRAVREMLQMAAGDGGTAPQAQTIGYSVGGKSGTARKQEGKGYSNKYRSWFVGLAPVSKPRVVVAVMVDEPSAGSFYGGTVAGPVFSGVVQQTLRSLNVTPDIEVQPHIVEHPAEGVQESF
jgi:cell division protein FtsI (penicillin-binding protein 3)